MWLTEQISEVHKASRQTVSARRVRRQPAKLIYIKPIVQPGSALVIESHAFFLEPIDHIGNIVGVL